MLWAQWLATRSDLSAVTAAAFVGCTGFTLVMPFLALYMQQLGVTEPAADAVTLLGKADAVLVQEDGKPIGVLTRQDLLEQARAGADLVVEAVREMIEALGLYREQ